MEEVVPCSSVQRTLSALTVGAGAMGVAVGLYIYVILDLFVLPEGTVGTVPVVVRELILVVGSMGVDMAVSIGVGIISHSRRVGVMMVVVGSRSRVVSG